MTSQCSGFYFKLFIEVYTHMEEYTIRKCTAQ